MVNYTNTTNKGYVRFRLTSEGLKLEKINNKIDFPLSWRSNVSAAHNMAIRTKFLQAMENDLKYMGDAGTTIRNLIITPKKTDGTPRPMPARPSAAATSRRCSRSSTRSSTMASDARSSSITS